MTLNFAEFTVHSKKIFEIKFDFKKLKSTTINTYQQFDLKQKKT